MAIRDDLLSFVRQALERGVARAEIRGVLLAAGWRAEEVDKALGAFADIDFAVPVPRPRPYLSARETFFYLLQFSALYLSAFNLGRLLFLLIERAFPDDIDLQPGRADYWTIAIRWAIASLVIAFPIFLVVSRSLTRAAAIDPERRASKVRKWLTYLTLFVTAGVVTADLITLLSNLLGGELTQRFLLKVLTVATIAGAAFSYYLWDLRDEERETS